MKHTKTPWYIGHTWNNQGNKILTIESEHPLETIVDETGVSFENAKHIVKCVNYFDELKETLSKCAVELSAYDCVDKVLAEDKGLIHTELTALTQAKQLLEKLEREEG